MSGGPIRSPLTGWRPSAWSISGPRATEMALNDPNAEWIGNVQPVGLVVAPAVLARLGLNPAEQTRADSEAVRALLSGDDDGPALPDPWAFFTQILG